MGVEAESLFFGQESESAKSIDGTDIDVFYGKPSCDETLQYIPIIQNMLDQMKLCAFQNRVWERSKEGKVVNLISIHPVIPLFCLDVYIMTACRVGITIWIDPCM